MATLRLLLIDDHPIALSGLAAEMSADERLTVVGKCQSVEEAIGILRHTCVDVIVSDLHLSDSLTALDLLGKLRERQLTIPFVVLSGDERPAAIRKALAIGVSAYLSKQSTGEAIRKAVYWVTELQNREQVYLWPPLLRQAMFMDTVVAPQLPLSLNQLTSKEKKVLQLYGQGAEPKEVAMSVEPRMALPTVYTHLQNIRRKLNLTNEIELRNFGLRYLSVQTESAMEISI